MNKHQSQMSPDQNKFHKGNGGDGKHYWITPHDVMSALNNEFGPFGSIMHMGKKKGPTAWMRKAIEEYRKGKFVCIVYPVDKWVLMMIEAIFGDRAQIRNIGDVKWLATEDGKPGKGTGRHIAAFILDPKAGVTP